MSDTSQADALSPDIAAALQDNGPMAAALRALVERIATIEHDIGVSFKARDFEIEAVENSVRQFEHHINALDTMVASLIKAGMLAAPRPDDDLAPPAPVMLDLGDGPARGDAVVVNLSLGGLFVGVVVDQLGDLLVVDGGTRTGVVTVAREHVVACPEAWRR